MSKLSKLRKHILKTRTSATSSPKHPLERSSLIRRASKREVLPQIFIILDSTNNRTKASQHRVFRAQFLDPIYGELEHSIPLRGEFLDGKKDGTWTYDNRKGLTEEGCYLDGKKEGLWIRRYNGKVISRVHYKGGLFHGTYTTWYPNGHKRSQEYYRDGQRDGKWFNWNIDGSAYAEGRYTQGQRDGLWRFWRHQMVEMGDYFNGEREGVWATWYANDQLFSVGRYRSGRRIGKWVFRHKSGLVSAVGHFSQGVKCGIWKHWNSSGAPKADRHYIRALDTQ